jgi:hypothetical protein
MVSRVQQRARAGEPAGRDRAGVPPRPDTAGPRPDTAGPLLALQRTAGNAAVSRLVVQRYEAWEHRQLGDAHGGAGRTVTLPNGVTLTYGQIVALSGDFYRSPEALLKAPESELRGVLAVMDRERGQAAASATHAPSPGQVNQNNADYEMATTGHDRVALNEPSLGGDADAATGPHGVVSGGEHIESGAPGPQAGFLDLAGQNAAHFSPDNIRANWVPKHQLALDLARSAWQERNLGKAPAAISGGDAPAVRTGRPVAEATAAPPRPATAPAAAAAAPGRPDPAAAPTPAGNADTRAAAGADEHAAQAWLTSGFSDHFLTDAFAAGHLVSGSDGRTICQAFYTAHKNAIVDACWTCAQAEGLTPELASGVVLTLQAVLDSKASSLLLKTAHDFYNANGIVVRNALGQQWRTFGDAALGGHAETIAMAELASKASRDAVQDVLDSGGTARANAALDYVPDVAQLAGGSWKGIAAFAADHSVWDPVLARSLHRTPADNPLYQLVKGNILPMGSTLARKGGRAAGQAAGSAWDRVTSVPGDVERWLGGLDQEIRRMYGVP